VINSRLLLKNLGANSVSTGITILFQLISVPLFIIYWGVNFYGEWIVLNTMTVYFSMSDIGLNTVTANEFSISYAQCKYGKCNILLNNNYFFIVSVFSVLFLGFGSVLCTINLSEFFHFKLISEKVAEIGIMILIGQVFLGMLINSLNTIYRATHNFARGMMIDNVIRFAENLVLLVGVASGISLLFLLLLYIIPKLVGLILKYFDAKKYFLFNISLSYFNWFEFKRIIIPALSFLSFPIGNSIVLQGFTLLVNFVMGSIAVVLFNTTRTLINFIKTGLSVIGNSTWPEFTLAYGRKDYETMKKMLRISVGVTFYLTIFLALFLAIFGKSIYVIWTGHRIEFDSVLFNIFLLTMVTSSISNATGVVLASTNNHKTLSILFLLSTAASLGLAYFILRITATISYIPVSLFVIDMVLIVYVINHALKIVDDTLQEFLKSVLLDPIYFIKSRINSANK